ncbi:hypothetical protein FQN57_002678 [Myotisia sp. PD_48]|nr:hypothetical protein FQN57_002678 [Myotisia sp. PD_48]
MPAARRLRTNGKDALISYISQQVDIRDNLDKGRGCVELVSLHHESRWNVTLAWILGSLTSLPWRNARLSCCHRILEVPGVNLSAVENKMGIYFNVYPLREARIFNVFGNYSSQVAVVFALEIALGTCIAGSHDRTTSIKRKYIAAREHFALVETGVLSAWLRDNDPSMVAGGRSEVDGTTHLECALLRINFRDKGVGSCWFGIGPLGQRVRIQSSRLFDGPDKVRQVSEVVLSTPFKEFPWDQQRWSLAKTLKTALKMRRRAEVDAGRRSIFQGVYRWIAFIEFTFPLF